MPNTTELMPIKEARDIIENRRRRLLQKMSALSWSINEHIKTDHIHEKVLNDAMELTLYLENYIKAYK